MTVSIRRFVGEHFLAPLLEAAETKKAWFKTIDNYPEFLESHSAAVTMEVEPEVMAHFFTYMATEWMYQPALQVYADKLSGLRDNYTALLNKADCEFLSNKLSDAGFQKMFAQFIEEMNNGSEPVSESALAEAIGSLHTLLKESHPDHTLLIGIE